MAVQAPAPAQLTVRTRVSRPPWTALGAAAFVVLMAAQIAVPLRPVHHRAGLTVIVVVALVLTTTAWSAAAWGPRRAVAGAAAVAGFAFAMERLGTATGWPFGRYHYDGVLQPTVAGVPIVVPLAWFAMAVPAWVVACRVTTRPVGRLMIGAVALAGWDLFLDPQMLREGYWTWVGGGFYRQVPLSNFAGWLGVAVVVMVVLSKVLPGRPQTLAARPTVALLGLYAWMAAMETVGFLLFFHDTVVGATGAAVMVPCAVAAIRRRPVWPAGG